MSKVLGPQITVDDAVKILRQNGFKTSVDKLRAGLVQGIYPFGDVVQRCDGLIKNDCYDVYTLQLKKWIEERTGSDNVLGM